MLLEHVGRVAIGERMMEQLKTLDRSQVYGVIDLRGRPKGKYSESVKIVLPEGVKLVKVLPEKVDVTLD